MIQFYMKVKGKTQGQFKAETKKAKRKDGGWMECHGFAYSSLVSYDAKTSQVKGSVSFDTLKVTRQQGGASPNFLQAHVTNEVIPEVVIEFVDRAADGTQEVVITRYTLTDAYVIAVTAQTIDSALEHEETNQWLNETIAFSFRTILVERPVEATSASFDFQKPG